MCQFQLKVNAKFTQLKNILCSNQDLDPITMGDLCRLKKEIIIVILIATCIKFFVEGKSF